MAKNKRNKADLLERLKAYPKLRLRSNKHLYIVDTADLPMHNVLGALGTIKAIHERLDYLETYDTGCLVRHGI
jgi:hypothetical protein